MIPWKFVHYEKEYYIKFKVELQLYLRFWQNLDEYKFLLNALIYHEIVI